MNIRSLGVGSHVAASSLRDFLEALRRLLFPRPIPVPVKKMQGFPVTLLVLTMALAVGTTACTKQTDTPASSSTDTTSSAPATTAAKQGEAAGGGSPVAQQMVAQKIVQDMTGATDIRQGRKAAEKIRAVSETHNADLNEIE